jgi:hypothetical protein
MGHCGRGGTVAMPIALLCLVSVLGPARADFVRYEFSGHDIISRAPVSGSFSYNSGAPYTNTFPLGWKFPLGAYYKDVGGNLTLTDNGHTYTNTSVFAELQSNILTVNSLTLFGNVPAGVGITVSLDWWGPPLGSILSLPPRIDPNRLLPSTFTLSTGDFPKDIGLGPITFSASATAIAPEPGALTLAAVAAVGGLAAARWRRRRSA